MIITVLSAKNIKNLSPIYLAISVLFISIAITLPLYKTSLSRWISFVTILTFSSGIMTLFMYTTSFSSNEKIKTKKIKVIFVLPLIMLLITPINRSGLIKRSIKNFTNVFMFLIIAMILLVSLLSISIHGHHPNQTISTSF